MNNIQTDGETNDIEITLILMIFMKKIYETIMEILNCKST